MIIITLSFSLSLSFFLKINGCNLEAPHILAPPATMHPDWPSVVPPKKRPCPELAAEDVKPPSGGEVLHIVSEALCARARGDNFNRVHREMAQKLHALGDAHARHFVAAGGLRLVGSLSSEKDARLRNTVVMAIKVIGYKHDKSCTRAEIARVIGSSILLSMIASEKPIYFVRSAVSIFAEVRARARSRIRAPLLRQPNVPSQACFQSKSFADDAASQDGATALACALKRHPAEMRLVAVALLAMSGVPRSEFPACLLAALDRIDVFDHADMASQNP